MFTSFAAVARLQLSEASLIAYLAPVLTALAAVWALGERLTVWRVAGVVLGFAGVLVLVWPDLGGGAADRRLAGYAFGIATAILTAFALLTLRSLARTEKPGAIAFYFIAASTLGGLATLPWGWTMPDAPVLGLLILSGLFGGAAHIAMTVAFRHAEASRLAPVEYVALLWTALADLAIFALALAPTFLLALPLMLGGAALAMLERRRGRLTANGVAKPL